MNTHFSSRLFLGLQAEQSQDDRRTEKVAAALHASHEALRVAREIDEQHGFRHWPLALDDGRGSSFYDILEAYWTDTIASILADQSPRKGGWGKPIRSDLATARMWRALLESARPNLPKPVAPFLFRLDDDFREKVYQAKVRENFRRVLGP